MDNTHHGDLIHRARFIIRQDLVSMHNNVKFVVIYKIRKWRAERAEILVALFDLDMRYDTM